MASTKDVIKFLSEWKQAKFIDFVPRQKNLEGLKSLGLTAGMAKSCLRSLSLENYVSGPEVDKDRGTKDIWVFGGRIHKTDVYMKIKLYEFNDMFQAKCLSFHPSEWPLRYPFKGGEKP